MKTFFCNRTVDKSEMKRLIKWVLLNYGTQKATRFVDHLKTLGFHSATTAGISLGIDDLRIPPVKPVFLKNAEKDILDNDLRYSRGQITAVERLEKALDIWNTTNDTLKNEVIAHFRETDIFNPVYMMAFSGARGNISQVRQLVGMRGLMADQQGQVLDFPIRRNFREGLTVTEYMISCYGARKGLVDTALRTANSGYLTRRLVDVAQSVIIQQFDCGTQDGLEVVPSPKHDCANIVGRVLLQPVIQAHTGKYIARKNTEISPALATRLVNYPKVVVRSPLTCRLNSVCQLCYGWDLSKHRLVQLGEAVGVLAAQSIGEPGTQLTMRTFHTGGVFAGEATEKVYAPYSGIISYSSSPRKPRGRKVTSRYGEPAFLTVDPVSIKISRHDVATSVILDFPAFTLLFVHPGQYVTFQQSIAELSRVDLDAQAPPTSTDVTEETKELFAKDSGQVSFDQMHLNTSSIIYPPSDFLDVYYPRSRFDRSILEEVPESDIKLRGKRKDGISVIDGDPARRPAMDWHGKASYVHQFFSDLTSGGMNNAYVAQQGFPYLPSVSPLSCTPHSQTEGTKPPYTLSVPQGADADAFMAPRRPWQLPSMASKESLETSSRLPIVFSKWSENEPFAPAKVGNVEGYGFMWILSGYLLHQTLMNCTGDYFHTRFHPLAFNGRTLTPGTDVPKETPCASTMYVTAAQTLLMRYGLVHQRHDMVGLTEATSVHAMSGSVRLTQARGAALPSEANGLHLSGAYSVKKRRHLRLNFRDVGRPSRWQAPLPERPRGKMCFRVGAHTTFLRQQTYEHVGTGGVRTGSRLTPSVPPISQEVLTPHLKTISTQMQKMFVSVATPSKSWKSLSQVFPYAEMTRAYTPQKTFWAYARMAFLAPPTQPLASFQGKENMVSRFPAFSYLSLREVFTSPRAHLDYLFPFDVEACTPSETGTPEGRPYVYSVEAEVRDPNLVVTPYNQHAFCTHGHRPTVSIGTYVREGDELFEGFYSPCSGQVTHMTETHLLLRRVQPYTLSHGSPVFVRDGAFVTPKKPFAALVSRESTAGDIVQGLPKVDELLEAREPVEKVLSSMHAQLAKLFLYYSKAYGLREGCRRSLQEIRRMLVHEVQEVYGSQGVFISDKHIEIIVRQMTTYVLIVDPGESTLLPGDIIDLRRVENLECKSPVQYRPILLGITRASLAAESFIAAASFQETKRVLTRAAVEGRIDWLTGLKENVILGRLIPAGTGLYV
ncbi:RNA polymerase beta'' chain (chloroplast) [Micromonas pusilla CCMP1545]|uniref:DNA-directed RNA polymerase subunit beta'' n=1 Tax=Micromonas pusilla (strain CCMP1545) TaxID=564608 RepID=C1KRB0_MICPC|nr:RNA polymerase beta'' chain [Micromonas pusilla CCMP1545]